MDNTNTLNGYVCFVEGVRHEIYAPTSYAAQVAAGKLYKGRKRNPRISVTLCELAGETVTQTAVD